MPFLLLLACKDNEPVDSAEPWRPEIACPGGAGCGDNAGALHAGAAALPITPTCLEAWEDLDASGSYTASKDSFDDCGCDGVCPEDEGWTAADTGEGDGVFQTVWMAGFNNGYPPHGVHDDLWARAVVLRQGETAVGIVSVDLVGFFNEDVQRVRASSASLDLDYILVSATHTHEGPDTMGIWGPSVVKTGYQADYVAYVVAQATEALRQASESAVEVASLTVGRVMPENEHPRGVANIIDDSRDPVVINDEVGAARFADASGNTIATMVNWGCHPETLGSDNPLITSDFAHYVRETVESGSRWEAYERAGLGGTAVYLQGMVGGMMTTLHTRVDTPDGDSYREASFEKAEAIGRLVGELALKAVGEGTDLVDPRLRVRAQSFRLPVENYGFQAMFLMGILSRTLYDYDPDRTIDENNMPTILTEVAVIDVGGLQLVSVPGELLPESAIGGYDGSKVGSSEYTLLDPENPNPPAVTAAPAGPYLRDEMTGDFEWIVGLGNDEIGYIIPKYDFKLDDVSPYFEEPEGDHYEETRSLGPETEGLLRAEIRRLLEWSE